MLAGNNITYTQVVTNAGPSAATTVTLDRSSAGEYDFSLIEPGRAGWTCTTVGTLTCTNPSLRVRAPATITFVVQGDCAEPQPGRRSTTLPASLRRPADPNSANNTATAADVVATGTQADLVVTNSPRQLRSRRAATSPTRRASRTTGPAAATTVTLHPDHAAEHELPVDHAPAGWTCGTAPTVGGTGTITCTDRQHSGGEYHGELSPSCCK